MTKKVFLISVIVLIIDQVSKGLIDAYLNVSKSISIINNFFYISNVHNRGAAWGIFSNKITFLVICTVIALIVIYRYLYTFKINNRNSIAFGFLIGGIIGNLIDRVFIGYVRDFLDFRFGNYNFPVFNVSDMAIVIGTFLLIIAIFKGEDKVNGVSSRRSKQESRQIRCK